MHKFTFHSNGFCPLLAGMICICCLISGCRMQARTDMFPSKEGYLVTIGEDPTDKDTRWAKYLYEHLKKRANDDEMVAFGISEKEMWRIIIQIDPTLQNGFKIACNLRLFCFRLSEYLFSRRPEPRQHRSDRAGRLRQQLGNMGA